MTNETQKEPIMINSDELLGYLEKYREQLFDDKTVRSMKFDYMQTAIHGAKVLVHKMRGTVMPREERTAWVK